MPKTPILLTILAVIISALAYYLYGNLNTRLVKSAPDTLGEKSRIVQSQIPASPFAKTVEKRDAYTIILVGDSMTQLLGENTDNLRKHLKNYYPDKTFGIFNYGLGSSNILSVEERFSKPTQLYGKDYPPILQREFELILIESFGHNPLSEYTLEEGLKKQTEALDKIVEKLKTTHPKSVIAFVATIAPNRNRYAEGTVVLEPEKRHEWADERTAYIKNHIQYANDHGLYLINIYEKSLKDGDGNIDYINTNDFIHPSPTGIEFISKEIADFIYKNQILPK